MPGKGGKQTSKKNKKRDEYYSQLGRRGNTRKSGKWTGDKSKEDKKTTDASTELMEDELW